MIDDGDSPRVPIIETMVTRINELQEYRERHDKALAFLCSWGFFDGSHHKAWAIDQAIRILSGDRYEQLVKDACNGEDGPDTYEWEEGIAP